MGQDTLPVGETKVDIPIQEVSATIISGDRNQSRPRLKILYPGNGDTYSVIRRQNQGIRSFETHLVVWNMGKKYLYHQGL